jgi:hypothetical protein
MTPPANTERDQNPRFPGDMMSPGGGRYDRFRLSYRDVQQSLVERGLEGAPEAIRKGAASWGRTRPLACDAVGPGRVTNGTWTRSGSRSPASRMTWGALGIKTTPGSISWGRASARRKPPSRSLASGAKA